MVRRVWVARGAEDEEAFDTSLFHRREQALSVPIRDRLQFKQR